jgi:hypothetical protein
MARAPDTRCGRPLGKDARDAIAPAKALDASSLGAGAVSGTEPEQPYQVMPPLAEAEYEALKASIAAGYDPAHPVVVDENGAVLDGHHRQQVCAGLGITAPIVMLPGLTEDQKHDYAVRANLACRHLTQLQKRELIAAELERGPGRSDREIGRLCGADHKTVASVRQSGEFPQTGRWQRGERTDEEELTACVEQLLDTSDDIAGQRAAALACAEHWRDWWHRVMATLLDLAEVWCPVITEHSGYANCWEWLQGQEGERADNWELLTRNVGVLQDAEASRFTAWWFGVDTEPLTPTLAEAELLLRGEP